MKEVLKFLKKNKPLEVTVVGPHGEKSQGYLLSNRLAVLGPKRDVLYLLNFVDGYNSSRYIPKDHVAILDQLFHIDETIEQLFEPTRFMEELTHIPDSYGDDHYRIWIDGVLVSETTNSYKAEQARDLFLKERKRKNIEFEHLMMKDPQNNRTDFLFNQTH